MKPPTKAALGLSLALVLAAATASCSLASLGTNAYVAKVNGLAISQSEFNKVLDQAKRRYGAVQHIDFNTDQGKQFLDGLKDSLVHQLVQREILSQEAEKRDIKVPEEEIKAKLEEIKKNYPDPKAFEEALKQFGFTVQDLRDQIHRNLAIEKLQFAVVGSSEVSQTEMQKYYSAHKSQYTHSEQVHAWHILIKPFGPVPGPKQDENALNKIKSIQARLAKGEDFGKLARESSEDPGSGRNGGDLGFFGKGQMVPEFEKAAFALKPGEVSKPVKTQFGYHLLKGGERRPAGVESYEKVKQRIAEDMMNQRKTASMQKLIGELEAKAKIEYNPQYAPKSPAPLPSGHVPVDHP